MSVFIRRFNFDPGEEVLLEIESVNILDLEPPAAINGVGTGTVLVVGEFENGPYKEPTEISGGLDLVNQFGSLGYTIGGQAGQNPCARKRTADGAITPEFWNGNGFVQLNAKRFRRLVVCRADTSIGEVTFNRQAFVKGAAAFAYNLEPAQVLSLDVGAGYLSATFSATAAIYTTAAGVYASTFVGGEQLVMSYDDEAPKTVTFQAADQSQAQVVARINSFFGFAFAAVGGAGVTTFTSLRRGTNAKVKLISATPLVLTALGATVNTTVGTGNVSDIDAVKFAEIKTIVEAAVTNSKVEQDSSGAIRVSAAYAAAGDYIVVGPLTTALGLGFTVGQYGSNDGIARIRSAAQTMPITTTSSITLGYDDQPDFSVALAAADTQAQIITKINNAAGYTMASSFSATVMYLAGKKNGGQVRIVAGTTTMLNELGLTLGQTTVAPTITSGIIPAGTVVTNSAQTNKLVTTQDTAVKSTSTGPYTARVRHALDDGTGVSAVAGTITVVVNAPDLGSFQCSNLLNISAAMTEAQIDAAYSDAIDATLDLNSVSKVVNITYSARQSNTVRRKLRENANTASSIGMFGRITMIRPPLGTTRAQAKSNVAEPGVGAYRSQRVIYCYPGAQTFVPLIARLGLNGGAGFTADGIVNVGADGFLASICSQLPPEENPGQETTFADGVVALESGDQTARWQMEDYIAFKSAGICALRIDSGVAIFQSGVTSVDPLVNPNLKNIARRRMADFIQDSMALRAKSYGKKLNKRIRRILLASEIRTFLAGLLSVDNPAAQRIDGYSVDESTGNTATSLAKGLYRILINVRTLSSLDSIVLATSIGENVTDVTEVLPQAA